MPRDLKVSRRLVNNLSDEKFQPWIVFLVLFSIYQINGDFLIGNDCKPNVYLALSVLQEGDLSFTPREIPFMFTWQYTDRDKTSIVNVSRLDSTVDGQTARERMDEGNLVPYEPRYQLVLVTPARTIKIPISHSS